MNERDSRHRPPTPGNAHDHGDRPNFANSRRWMLSVASAAETSPCQCRLWRYLQLLVMAAATGLHVPVSGGPAMTKTTTMTKHHQSDVDANDDAFEEKSLLKCSSSRFSRSCSCCCCCCHIEREACKLVSFSTAGHDDVVDFSIAPSSPSFFLSKNDGAAGSSSSRCSLVVPTTMACTRRIFRGRKVGHTSRSPILGSVIGLS
jgi:hypothetical protein